MGLGPTHPKWWQHGRFIYCTHGATLAGRGLLPACTHPTCSPLPPNVHGHILAPNNPRRARAWRPMFFGEKLRASPTPPSLIKHHPWPTACTATLLPMLMWQCTSLSTASTVLQYQAVQQYGWLGVHTPPSTCQSPQLTPPPLLLAPVVTTSI